MTATATPTVTYRPSRAFAEIRVMSAALGIVAMSVLLSIAVAVSVLGAVDRSGVERPAPGPIPQPITAPAAPSEPQPITAPAGLDL
jgi:hypothetical protein